MSFTLVPPAPPAHAAVLEKLASSGLLEDCKPLLWLPTWDLEQGRPSSQVTISGNMRVGGHVFRLRIHLPEEFPLCLPEIELDRSSASIDLPHMLMGSRLCFDAGENLLDRRDPWGIMKESLLRAQELLAAMLAGNRAAEFAQEAVAYWRTIADGRSIDCVVEASEHPHPTQALFREGQLHAVADDLETYRQSLSDRSGASLTPKNAAYLPLDPVAADPSFLPSKLLTLEGLRKYFRALPEQDRGMARLLPALQSQREVLLVLGLRRPQGERALLGVHLVGIQGAHPLERNDSQATLQPIELVRRDRTFLAPRGGASVDLYKRRVLIAGCGAVGGYLALAMARAGVGALSLVDQDLFTLENTYRHACGMAYTGQPKAVGLKSELERAVPYISVMPYPMSLRAFLELHPSALQEHDLVLSVLGAPTTELDLNERVWSDAKNPPALFSWLEPLGLGGHALLTHAREESDTARGCLECLYYRYVQGGPLDNQAAFAKPGAIYTRDTLGCGSQFLPFADLDAQRTAELAARLALQVLQGGVAEFQLRSWRGDRRVFEHAGYSVTENFDLQPSSASYIRDDCPVCAAR